MPIFLPIGPLGPRSVPIFLPIGRAHSHRGQGNATRPTIVAHQCAHRPRPSLTPTILPIVRCIALPIIAPTSSAHCRAHCRAHCLVIQPDIDAGRTPMSGAVLVHRGEPRRIVEDDRAASAGVQP